MFPGAAAPHRPDGTFRLGYEPMEEPLQRLEVAARAHGIEDKVLVLTEGKPVVV